MTYVRIRFLKNDNVYGKEYTYAIPDGLQLKVGDVVQINDKATGFVTGFATDEDVASFKDSVKTILGKVQ